MWPTLEERVFEHAEDGIPRLPSGSIQSWPVVFTGTASGYACVWLRGVVLTCLTLGFYLPWARIACQRYLLQQTSVAGHALDDLRSPWAMLVRQCLGLSLLGGVAMAWMGLPVSGLGAATLALAVWPMFKLMCLSERVDGITWARRSLAFDASLTEFYQVWGMPLFGMAMLVWSWLGVARVGHAVAWVLWGMAFGLWLLNLPAWYWGHLHLRQTHIRLGPLRLRWRLGPDAIFGLVIETLGGALLALLLNLGVLAMCLGGWLWWQASHGHGAVGQMGWLWMLLGGCVMASAWMVLPEAQVRLYKLVWNRTGNRHVRVRCRLKVHVCVRMQRRHALMMLVTLGMYWPWAVVQSRRMRMRSTVLQSRVGLNVLEAHWPVK
jgi:uncharacterized membrane protein YjgN (DUF898 family)